MRNKVLLGILFLAFVLRFYALGTNPPALTWDEAAWGYNAYALGIDGKDEFGRFLPLDYLESFGDFKPPLYAYLDILPIKLFGLTEFATRVPSSFFGVLTVLMTYFLVRRIFLTSKKRELYAVTAMGILAISPWHILLSRAAFEANVATFFLVFGIYAFLRAIQDSPRFIILAALSFVLSVYTFNTSRIFAPLIIVAMAIFYRKEIWRIRKMSVAAVILGILMLLPSINFLISPQARLRYQEVNIFSDVNLVKFSNQEVENDHGAWWSKIIHNRRIIYAREYMKHYFDNLSFDFLFIKGDGNTKFSTQDVGQMYLWELPFLIIGLFLLLRRRENNWFLIPVWLILGIIPAATARETPHALRIETTLPTFQILAAYGLVNTIIYMKKYRQVAAGGLGAVAFLFLIYFLHVYFVLYPWLYSDNWQYGYKESVEYVNSVKAKYDRIVNVNVMGRPYIYYLFYQKTPPQQFRETAQIKRDVFGFVRIDGYGKYSFPDKIGAKLNSGKTLYITSAEEKLPFGVNPLKVFKRLDGSPVLQAYSL